MGSPHLPPPPLLEPAWYPDPTGRYEARYWDGRKWTSHISHYGATGVDPLLRARWDRSWVRIAGRVILWGALAGVAYWAYDTYWPEDDRDLEAEQSVMESAVLIRSDLPTDAAWTAGGPEAVSPLDVDVDDEGQVALVACEGFGSSAGDADDEPTAAAQFEASDGVRAVANKVTIGGGSGLAEGYLEVLRDPETAECLGLTWASSRGGTGAVVETIQAMQDPAFGDDAVWWRLAGTDTAGAFTVGVFVDMVFVRVDRVVSEFTFTGVAEPIGAGVQRDVIGREVARLGELLNALDAEDESDETDEGDQGDDTEESDPFGGEGGAGVEDGSAPDDGS